MPASEFRPVPLEPGTGTWNRYRTYCDLLPRLQHFGAARLHLLPPLGDLLLLLGRQHLEDLRLHLRLREGELGLRVADLDAQRLKIALVARHHGVVDRFTRGVRALGERPDAIGVTLVNRPHLLALRVGQIAHHLSECEGAAHRSAHAPARSAGSGRTRGRRAALLLSPVPVADPAPSRRTARLPQARVPRRLLPEMCSSSVCLVRQVGPTTTLD